MLFSLTASAQKEQKEQAKPISLSQPVKNDKPVENSNVLSQPTSKKEPTIAAKPSIIELANNADFSIATIAKEANRMKEKEENEVYISLH